MATATSLENIPATAYLSPGDFTTPYDSMPVNADRPAKQRAMIERYNPTVLYYFIGSNGTWGAMFADGGLLTTYERIGYHACTSALLEAILESGKPLVVYRYGKPETWLVPMPE